MPIRSLDHVNVRTTQLDAMVRFYEDILGLKNGSRPDFGFPGAWLYAGDKPYVHLVGVDAIPEQPELQLEHFALGATGLADFVAGLIAQNVPHTLDPVPGYPIVQVNLRDPDGNHIHVDFDDAEMAGLG